MSREMKVSFHPNEDGITVALAINKHLIEPEVPYVPERLVDQRALVLKMWASSNGVEINQLVFEDDDVKEEMEYHFHYLEKAIYVTKAIQRKGRTKFFSL